MSSPFDRADEIVRGLSSQLGVEPANVLPEPVDTRLEPQAPERARPRLLEGRHDNVVPLTASMVGKRLEDLLGRAQEIHKQAETLAVALAGPPMPQARGLEPRGSRPVTETLFSKQMNGLDELGQVLDNLGRSLERAHRALG